MKEILLVEVNRNIRREVAFNINAICTHIGRFPGLNTEGLLQAVSVTNQSTSVTDQLNTVTGNDVSLVVLDQKYTIPHKLDTVHCMLSHWNNDVGIKDLISDKSW